MTDVRKRPLVVLGLAALALAAVAAVYHVTAVAAYDTAAGSGTMGSRLFAARAAMYMEPWNARFGWRATTVRAQELLDAGRIDPAFWLLESLSQTVRGDVFYRATYQRAVTLKAPLDARKAHAQHAKEKAGGVLLEEDVQH